MNITPLKKSKEYLVKGLIYPVPNPELPFLGVHFTQTMKGYVEAGPNAVLATKREGYRKRDISIRDSLETFTYSGFWNLLKNDWKTGIWEINRSLRKSVFVKESKRTHTRGKWFRFRRRWFWSKSSSSCTRWYFDR